MNYCLPPTELENIKQAVKDGKLSPESFDVSSKLRRKMLEGIVGKDHAEEINTIYEKNLLLKNKEAAILKTIEEMTGLNKEKKRNLSEKAKARVAERQRRLYDPSHDEYMLNEITSDIYSKKYDSEVSLEQAQKITELSSDAKKAKKELVENGKEGFGAAKVALDNYLSDLISEASKSKNRLTNPLNEKGLKAKLRSFIDNGWISAKFILNNSRAIPTGRDNSFFGRQGSKLFWDPSTNKAWVKGFTKSWIDIAKIIKGEIGITSKLDALKGDDAIRVGKAIENAAKAKIYERPNYLNGRYEGNFGKGETGEALDIATGEELYQGVSLGKIPIIGRTFEAGRVAYESGALTLRADAADIFYDLAEKARKDMTDNKEIGSVNSMINSITGRGKWSKHSGDAEKVFNEVMFSAKNIKSQVDFVFGPAVYVGKKILGKATTAGEQQRASNFLHVVVATGLLMEFAKLMNPDDNEDIFNPKSSNFGKIKNGKMTLDLTSGYGGLVTAVARILLKESTSGATGITRKLNSGYGSQTATDIFWGYFENRFSPMASLLKTIVNQKNFEGEKPTVHGEVTKLIIPITDQNLYQFRNESVVHQFIAFMADNNGINTGLDRPESDWDESASKKLMQFKESVGEKVFKEANDSFNKDFDEWFANVRKQQDYKDLSDENKLELLSKKKSLLLRTIFDDYSFTYEPEEKEPLPDLLNT